MPNFTFTTGRPAGNLTPAQNRPDMETNNDSTNSILQQDLYGFNDNNGGTHKYVTVPLNTTPGAQTNPQSIIYTAQATGGVYTNYSLPYFRNQSGILPMLPDLSNTGTNYGYQIGNLIYNVGVASIAQGASSANVTWKVPFTTALINVQMTIRTTGTGSSGSQKVISADGNLTTGTFSCYGGNLASGNLVFWYSAVGY